MSIRTVAKASFFLVGSALLAILFNNASYPLKSSPASLRSYAYNKISKTALHNAISPQVATLNPQPFTPQNIPVTPFGYGPTRQVLATSPTPLSGKAYCANLNQNGAWNCASVSGESAPGAANACSANVPQGQLVTCFQSLNNVVNEAPFAPVNCDGYDIGGPSPILSTNDFCLD